MVEKQSVSNQQVGERWMKRKGSRKWEMEEGHDCAGVQKSKGGAVGVGAHHILPLPLGIRKHGP